MAAVTVLVDPAIGSTMVREEHQTSMVTLGCVGQQVEGRIVVEKEVLGVTSLRADDIGSLDRVTTEKDREVQSHLENE